MKTWSLADVFDVFKKVEQLTRPPRRDEPADEPVERPDCSCGLGDDVRLREHWSSCAVWDDQAGPIADGPPLIIGRDVTVGPRYCGSCGEHHDDPCTAMFEPSWLGRLTEDDDPKLADMEAEMDRQVAAQVRVPLDEEDGMFIAVAEPQGGLGNFPGLDARLTDKLASLIKPGTTHLEVFKDTTQEDILAQLCQLTYFVEDIRNILQNSPAASAPGVSGEAVSPPPDGPASPHSDLSANQQAKRAAEIIDRHFPDSSELSYIKCGCRFECDRVSTWARHVAAELHPQT